MLKDKVVVITGSSQGIGKATAMAFLGHGAKVVLNGRNPDRLKKTEEELRETGGDIYAVLGDVAREEDAKALIEQVIQRFGRLDILINNAGVSMRGNFAELEPKVYRSVFDTNVLGVTNLTIPAMPYVRASKGSIVFVSSLAGIRGLPGLSAYCASKMALRGIAESIRIEEAGSGIHVGLIQVGQTEIEGDKQTISADGSLVSIPSRSNFRVATRESVADAILCNVKKRKFITTLTGLGKLNALMQSIAPGLVEKILISQADRIARRS